MPGRGRTPGSSPIDRTWEPCSSANGAPAKVCGTFQIELFFTCIKQNLKIKVFYGTSKNAVLIQIWTALIAYLLLIWLKFKSKAGWGLLEFTRLAQTMLMERFDLWAMLCPRDLIIVSPYYSISVPDSSDNLEMILIGLKKMEIGCK